MRLGITLPLIDIKGDPATVRDFAQAAEGLGYHHLGAPDHVLGVNVASRPDWGAAIPPRTSSTILRAVRLPQRLHQHDRVLDAGDDPAAAADGAGRQAGRLARRAVGRALPLRHRHRLEPGRVRRPERGLQEPRQALGGAGARSCGRCGPSRTSPSRASGTRIDDAGINPLPTRRRSRSGSAATRTPRCGASPSGATAGSCWRIPAGAVANAEFAKLRGYIKEAGRDPRTVGLEVWVSTGEGGPEDWRKQFQAWKDAGVTHVTVNSCYSRGPHKRIAGRTVSDHMAAMKQYHAAVADLL